MNGSTDHDHTRGLYVVLGASGGIGRAVVAAADAAGHQVRAVSRTISSAHDLPPGVERLDADVSTPAGAATAVAGAAVVVHAAQPDYTRWRQEFPALTHGIADAAAAEGAKLVLADNLYLYGPQPDGGSMSESTPAAAGDAKGRVRATMAQDLLARHARGDLRVAIGRASDYYGPHGTGTALGSSFFPAALRGRTVNTAGSVHAAHTMSYLPDIGAGLLALAERDIADGRAWHLPVAEPLTMRQFADLVAAEIHRPVKLRAAGARTLRLIGFAVPMMREIADIAYQWDAPFVVDDSAFRTHLPGRDTRHRSPTGRHRHRAMVADVHLDRLTSTAGGLTSVGITPGPRPAPHHDHDPRGPPRNRPILRGRRRVAP